MNENIDLTKILDGCPEGTKLYSPIFGEVSFDKIEKGVFSKIGVYVKNWGGACFSPEGHYYRTGGDAEVVLFPSKDQRDWSKFERFWDKPKVEKFDPKTFQPFDKVLSKYYIDKEWTCGILSHPYCHSGFNGFIVNSNFVRYCIPYNEETKHLVGTTNDCPAYYKWWED